MEGRNIHNRKLLRSGSIAWVVVLIVLAVIGRSSFADGSEEVQKPVPEEAQLHQKIEALEEKLEAATYQIDRVLKKVDDLLWFQRVGDVADIDKIFIPTVPNPHGDEEYGITHERHPFRMYSYVFVPKGLDRSKKHPLLMFPHGGVHSDFNTYYTHIVRELMERGYVVVAPEYRGSTGYGKSYYESIDYGGLEVDDVVATRDWALETMSFLDDGRVGILGWSHGGLIALLAVFEHPEKFEVAYAGVPVSDLVARMGYQTQEYRDLYSADYHIGKTAYEDVEEYRRRSPAWNAQKLETPLLIHTNTNDRDVHVLEVEHLIKTLKAEGKDFQYRIYEDAPGGHSFNRTDTLLARESRNEIYAFLGKYLKK
jgi:dipeptidyl aminopeptidase/acylaminoacyl peptidase